MSWTEGSAAARSTSASLNPAPPNSSNRALRAPGSPFATSSSRMCSSLCRWLTDILPATSPRRWRAAHRGRHHRGRRRQHPPPRSSALADLTRFRWRHGLCTAAERLRPGVPAGPLAADLLEVRPHHLAVEGVLRVTPHLGGAARAFQVTPSRAHDRVVEGQQRFGDPVRRPVLLEGFRLVGDEPGVMQHAERMCQVRGLALQVAGNAAAAGVAVGDRREHRVVERGVAHVGFLGEDVTRLTEQRPAGIEYRPAHPRVEIAGAGRDVVLGELPAVGRGPPTMAFVSTAVRRSLIPQNSSPAGSPASGQQAQVRPCRAAAHCRQAASP